MVPFPSQLHKTVGSDRKQGMTLHLVTFPGQRKQLRLLYGQETFDAGVVTSLHAPAVVLLKQFRYGCIKLLQGMKDTVPQRSVYTPVALVHGILDQGLVLGTSYSGRLCTATVMRGKVIQ